MNPPQRAILVLECDRHTLIVLRSLSNAGYRILLGASFDDWTWGYVPYSNRVDEHWLHPSIDNNPELFSEALLDFLASRSDIDLVFPIGENSLRVLVEIYEDAMQYCELVMPRPAVVEQCLDKSRAGRIAAAADVDLPREIEVDNNDALLAAVDTMGTACVIKPLDSRHLLFGRKCLFTDRPGWLKEWVWPANHRRLLVQTRIRGHRHNCMFVAHDGELMRYFESEVLRTDCCDYSGYSVMDRSVAPSQTRLDACRRIIASLDYSGIGCIQFLVGADDDSSTFLEINPRVDSTIALPVACGLDLPRLAVEANRLTPATVGETYRIGYRRHWMYGDWRGMLSDWRRKDAGFAASMARLLVMLRDGMKAEVSTDIFLDDPRPLLRLYGQKWFGLWRRLGLSAGSAAMRH